MYCTFTDCEIHTCTVKNESIFFVLTLNGKTSIASISLMSQSDEINYIIDDVKIR